MTATALQRTADFCRDPLGFADFKLFPGQGHLIVRRGSAEIHLWLASAVDEARHHGSTSSCYIRVQHIAPLHQELPKRQAPFRYSLTRQPRGMHETPVDDPFGNAIRFGEALSDRATKTWFGLEPTSWHLGRESSSRRRWMRPDFLC